MGSQFLRRGVTYNFLTFPLKSCLTVGMIVLLILTIHYSLFYLFIFKRLPGYANKKYSSGSNVAVISKGVQGKSNSFNISYVEENLYVLDQDDPQLIQYTRARYLTPPSKRPYRLSGEGIFFDVFSTIIGKIFKFKKDGIFIEAGANEGETASHTLFLEKNLGWTGLLVECNPPVVPKLKSRHRKAWIASACLSPTGTVGVLNFSNPTEWSYSGTLNKPWDIPNMQENWTTFEVDTVPLYTLIAALGWKEIDYFSFDIEGSELDVLKTFPFDKVIFKVLIIEVQFYTQAEKNELHMLLVSNNYLFAIDLKADRLYIHNSVKHLLQPTDK